MSAATEPTQPPPAKAGAADPLAPAASAVATAEVLIEALPYIREFWGTTVVVKYGGNAMTDPALADTFAADVVLLQSVGIRVVVVHGGGPQIGDLMDRLGMQPEFRDGLRVTDAETLDIARMVLVGKVNREIVAAINTHGPLAVGLSGEDAGLIQASLRDPDLGFVGDVTKVNPAIVESLLAQNLIPVVSTIGADLLGQAYNINADAVAGALAGALGAEKVIYLTDIAGLLRDVDDPASLIATTDTAEIAQLIASGALSGGMIPKIQACLDALGRGVTSAHLLDGRVPHVVLLELFTHAGVGTMITTAPEGLS
ncbi:MAG TPA: acetylglutamate kinase [Acidimicrobiales bacterium]